MSFIPGLWRPSWADCFVLGLHSGVLTTKLDSLRLSPYNCVKRKVIIMIRVTMFSTKKTINGGHDDDPNQYYYKL
ncbi:hypothetical protein, partial [Heyndrickxia sporothermodurans]|uniref:hypothetical protein n=1 Tax=Heyndrickxia sporothermodurans TaxID=46224 RepID=UPI001F33C212